ncbi:MAG: hypothetical protein R6X19_09355 [Kiritimatiellia bacterium]
MGGLPGSAGGLGADVVLWLAQRHTGLTLPEIAKAAGVADHRAAGKAVERMEKRMREERELKQNAAQGEKSFVVCRDLTP